MSTTVDSRVVEMRFDNKQFESGVSTTMSTLDKLKQKLNLSGASKGLTELNSAAGKVNMNGLGSAVEQVSMKFSALQVAGVTALANITNSAVNAGKRMVAALTIDPVKSGFQEYETQINAVQTILANTQKEGTNVETVNKALDELNLYADKTIYNFTEMTRNIGTFTAAGVKLDTSVSAIQGIANLAAVSGSTSQQASTAMYQLSQALAAGTVKLMDWNSVVNAGMGGQVFQDALKQTSELLGTGAEAAIKAEGSFRESLSKGWLTAEVLTETLKKFTTSGAAEYLAEFTGLSQETVDATLEATDAWGDEADAVDKAAEALANKSGKNKDEIKDALNMAKNAEEAATKVKTFSQLWDVMKEAAQSGWAQTWRLIVGDFEEAKSLLTPLADFFTGVINKMSDARNKLLESALGKGFTELAEKVKTVVTPIQNTSEAISTVVDSLKDYDVLVDEIIAGKWGNAPTRWEELTEAGYDWAYAQNLVNERLGDSTRHATNYSEAAGEATKSTENATEATTDLTEEQKKQLIELSKLSDEQLRSKGYTEEQIKALRELQAVAKKIGVPFDEFINKLDEINGRWLLMNSFKNIGQAIVKPLKAIAQAWKEIFKPLSGEGIFNAIAGFHKLTSLLVISDESAEKLKNTFKGIFSVFKMVGTLISGGFKIAFTFLKELFSGLNIELGGLSTVLGDGLQKFSNWVLNTKDLQGAIQKVIDKIPNAVKKIKAWFASFKENPVVEKFVTAMSKVASTIKQICSLDPKSFSIKDLLPMLKENLGSALKSLPSTMVEVGKNIIAGLKNGLGDGVSDVFSKIVEIGTTIITKIKEVLGIHSPSTVMHEIGTNVVQGFINGIKEKLGEVGTTIKEFGGKVVEFFNNIDWDSVFAGTMLGSLVWFTVKISKTLDVIADAVGGFSSVCAGINTALTDFGKMMKGIGFDFKAKGILKIAIAIGIIAAAIIIMSFIDVKSLWKSVAVIGAIAGILVILTIALNQMSSATVNVNRNGLNIDGVKQNLIAIGTTVLLMAMAVKMIGKLSPEEAKQGFLGLAGMVGAMIIVLAAYNKLVNNKHTKELDKLGKMLLKLSAAMFLMAIMCKIVGRLSPEEMVKGTIFAAGFVVFVYAIMRVTKGYTTRQIDKVGKMITKLVAAMLLMVIVCKLVGKLSAGEMIKGALFASAFVIFVKYLVRVTKIGKNDQIAKLGGLLLSISVSLLLMVGMCKLVGQLTAGEMIKGGIFMAGFIIFVKALVSILKVTNETELYKIASTILAMSVSIAILAGVCVLLGFMDIGHLAKGVAAVAILGLIMKGMISALKNAKAISKTMMWMAIAIGIMAASVIALSFVDPGKLAGATAAMAILMGMFALMEKSLKHVEKGAITILLMAGIIAGLTAVLFLLSDLDTTSVLGSAAALSMLLLSLSACMKILDTMNWKDKKVGEIAKTVLALTAMAIPMLAFTLVLRQMNGIEDAVGKVKALSILMSVMTGLLGAVTLISGIAKYAGMGSSIAIGIVALTAMVIPMLTFIWALKQMNGIEDTSEKITALVKMMGAMTLLLGALTIIGLGGPAAVIGIGSLVVLFAAIGGLALGIGKLMETFPNIQKFLDTGLPVLEQLAGGIGTMIGKFIGGIGEGISDSFVKIGDDIATFMDKLSIASENASGIKGESFDGVKNLIDVMGEIALLTVGTTFSDIFTFGGTSMEKFEKDGVAFFEAMKGISEASQGITINEDGMNAVVNMATKIAKLQAHLEPIGGVMSWFKGRDDLATFGDNIGDFITSMKTAIGNLDGVTVNEESLNAIITATSDLAKLQSKLEPIGGVITWFKGRDDLASFGYNIGQFISSMKLALSSLDDITFNEESLNTIISATSDLAGLQASLEPIGGVISWFEGRDDLATFGENVGEFISSMKTALSSLTDVTLDEESLTSIITAAEKLAELQESLEPMGGVISWFKGRDDLGEFGDNVKLFAEGMAKLKEGMGEDGISQTVVDSVVNAGNAIVALNNTLPEEHIFDGKMNLTDFSDYISDFATAMSDFASKASEIDAAAVSSVISTAFRIKNLITSLVGLDTSGLTAFTGIGTGGIGADGAAYKIAKAISTYSDEVAGIDTAAVSTSVSAAMKLRSLIAGLVGLDTSGLENFKPGTIGKAMKSYNESVQGMDTAIVSSSISSANRLKNFIASLAGLDTSGIGNFKIDTIGSSLKSYASSVSGFNITAVMSSITAANRLKLFISSLSGLNGSGVSTFKKAIDELSSVNIDGIVNAFTGAASKLVNAGSKMMDGLVKGLKSKSSATSSAIKSILKVINDAIKERVQSFNEAGGAMMTKLAGGISAKKNIVTSALRSSLNMIKTAIRSYYNNFYEAGGYLGSGLVAGIKAKQDAAYRAGYALGQKAVEGEKDGQKSNSPSKLTIQAGKWLGEGLVIGMQKMGANVYNAGRDLGSSAAQSMTNVVSRMSDALEYGMDSQPTIRPVVDLSNVNSGAAAINSMFSNGISLGVSSNLSAVGSMMSRRNQNGTNSEVISAIKELKGSLDNGRSGDTYNLNGVSYTADEEVANAIKLITRAAGLERRA